MASKTILARELPAKARSNTCAAVVTSLLKVHHSPHSGDGGSGGVLFQAAIIAAAAGVAIGEDGHVAEFACHALAATQDFAVDDDAATDASAERQKNHVFDAAACPPSTFHPVRQRWHRFPR